MTREELKLEWVININQNKDEKSLETSHSRTF